jgi:hypothetical protein
MARDRKSSDPTPEATQPVSPVEEVGEAPLGSSGDFGGEVASPTAKSRSKKPPTEWTLTKDSDITLTMPSGKWKLTLNDAGRPTMQLIEKF